jgi:hypothetical protein
VSADDDKAAAMRDQIERLQRLDQSTTVDRSPRLLRGTIRNYKKTRQTQDFMFTQTDRDRMGAASVAAAMEGLGGLAIGLAGSALDSRDPADLLEFELDGKPIRAWVWISVFGEGDEVEVVAEPMGDVWQGYAIRRVSDHMLALHPHCSRGRYAHYRASFKWFIIGYTIIFIVFFFIVLTTSIINKYDLNPILIVTIYVFFGGGAIYGIIAWRVARKYMGIVKLAESIFKVFGWKDVKNIDLPALTKKYKKPGDPGALGVLFFRY